MGGEPGGPGDPRWPNPEVAMSQPVPEQKCLNCDKQLNRVSVTGPEDPVPTPGDATVCLGCGHLMIFTDTMGLRNPNEDELKELAGRRDILDTMEFITEYRKHYG